ncbi:dethiobiotin synthase [Halarchaeum sp. P4]|uniref:dethiobiotin synthase n=1 Tax=Halarchaeum sp. P4 TaxID=3421639 RepID=UPI003EC11623
MLAIENFAVVGTGTGVGKTVVTAGLVGAFREADVDACGVKPAQTGFPPADDAGFVADACGSEEASTCLRQLEPALAPAVAAEQAGETLSYEVIREGCTQAVRAADIGVVEGIGGLRVPLADSREVIDLVADLGLPAVVVARAGLGTLNHSALTVEALRRRDVEVTGIVLNDYTGETLAERTNPDVLAEMTGCQVETLPSLDLDDPVDAVEGVREHLSTGILPTCESQRTPPGRPP